MEKNDAINKRVQEIKRPAMAPVQMGRPLPLAPDAVKRAIFERLNAKRERQHVRGKREKIGSPAKKIFYTLSRIFRSKDRRHVAELDTFAGELSSYIDYLWSIIILPPNTTISFEHRLKARTLIFGSGMGGIKVFAQAQRDVNNASRGGT